VIWNKSELRASYQDLQAYAPSWMTIRCTVNSQMFGIRPVADGPNLGGTSFTHSPTAAQITLVYIKISFSLSEVDCSHLVQSFTIVHASKTCLYFSKNKCSYFSHLFKSSYTFSVVISLNPETKQAFYIENGFQCSFYRSWLTVNTETLPYFISSHVHSITMWNASQEVDTRKNTLLQQEAWQYFHVRHLCTFTI